MVVFGIAFIGGGAAMVYLWKKGEPERKAKWGKFTASTIEGDTVYYVATRSSMSSGCWEFSTKNGSDTSHFALNSSAVISKIQVGNTLTKDSNSTIFIFKGNRENVYIDYAKYRVK